MVVIGNQDAVWGFALVGVRGRVVTTREEVNQALDVVLANEDLGVLLVTEDAADLARQRVDELKVRSMHPLLVEIPGPGGPRPDRPDIGEIIQRTIGVRL